jgi:hypothetical protein
VGPAGQWIPTPSLCAALIASGRRLVQWPMMVKAPWNSISVSKICVEHSIKFYFILKKLMIKVWFNDRQHTPKLRFLLILEQSKDLGSVDQELRQLMSTPYKYLMHNLPLLSIGSLNKLALCRTHTFGFCIGVYLLFHSLSLVVEWMNSHHRNISYFLFTFLSWSFWSSVSKKV